ncbi:S8 family serine peptidase [Cellulomonas sp. SG140]|uniref:S8 family serine peptidase n=1 Tax=Cellulomonas sp. SG140 TaxID=2976536 RepID=UPI0021E99662|nr:S8 family serine peptidase [Cellulomonas sp. SG140]
MTRRSGTRMWAVAVGAAVATALGTIPAQAAPPDPGPTGRFTAAAVTPSSAPIDTPKASRARLAQSDPALLARTDTAPTTIMVKLDYDAAAAYSGDVAGFAATSPEVTGKALRTGDSNVSSYLRLLGGKADKASAAVRAAVPSATVRGTYNLAYGGLAVTLPANRAKDLLKVPGVVAVQQDALEHVQTELGSGVSTTALAGTTAAPTAGALENGTTAFVGAEKVWPSLGGRDHAGQGVIVGVLDTGIWPEHPMLTDVGLPKPAGGPWACQFGDGSDPALGAAFTCNDKLIGAYAFLDTARAQGAIGKDEYCSATACSVRDADGHGTHTATTAAGSYVASAPLLGTDRGPVAGMAPGASVIAYKVCAVAGCYQSDSVAAVQQAILDGVDVINYSISGGTSAYTDPVELAFLDAYEAGISVNASAGNDGPTAGTANHAGPWVTTVGASTSDRAFASVLHLTAADGATYTKQGATLTTGVTDAPVVLAADVPGYTGGQYCLKPFAAGSLTGKVVVCERGGGGGGRVEKGYFASQGGAAGMVLYNPTPSDTETDNHFLPAIHLEGPNDELLAFLAAHTGVTATWATGALTPATGDVMAGFSSRGPVGDFLKPDITAPGVQVLAGNTPTPVDIPAGPKGQLYQAIAGTSMSSPHATGISALVRAAHPDWTPGQVKSALMTSSLQSVVNADGGPAGVFDRGAGSIRADRAVQPTLTFDVSAKDMAASATDPLHRVDLDLPSIAVNPLPGALLTTRTAKNVSGRTLAFSAAATGADGLKVTVQPARFTLRPGQTQRLRILVDGTATAHGWHSGQITLTSGGAVPVVLPVVVNTGDAAVHLTQTCDPTTLARGASTDCTVTATNFAAVAAPTTVEVSSTPGLPITSVAAPGTATRSGLRWTGTLSPALPPTITSITPGASPAGGYLPLSSFGIPAATGFGDETITNYDVPAFQYGGETYTRIGIDSNGYVVVGGGTAEDNDCCNTQTFPDPTRPNNVLAPYWTDLSLDPASGGGAIRVGTLSDGTNHWLVVDYDQVQAWGHGPASSFEVWIQTGTTEGQWFSYGTLGGSAGAPLSSGAENRDGTSGVNITAASGTEWAITTAPPTPGGSVSLGYRATARQPGTQTLTARLSSPIIRATPVVQTAVTVTRR